MRAMMITVGTGDTVEHGIAFSIDSGNPELVVLMCTEASEAKFDLIREAVRSPGPGQLETMRVHDPADFDRTYADCRGALARIAALGYPPEDTAVDYTGGTKVMAAAAVAAGADHGVSRYVYIDGLHREGAGQRVVSSTEQSRVTGAGPMLARRYLLAAVEALNRYQWQAVEALTADARAACAAPEVCSGADALARLGACYAAWDAFDHAAAWELLRPLGDEHEALLHVDLSGNKAVLGRLARGAHDLAGDEGPLLLADLLNNAARRLEPALYDDAVARLYRATELIAQVRLARLDPPIPRTSGVPLEAIPQPLRDAWGGRAGADGTLQLGLRMAFQLLAALGDEFGEWFLRHRGLQGALTARNASILAHDLIPVGEQVARTLYGIVSEKALDVDGRIEQLRGSGAFVCVSL